MDTKIDSTDEARQYLLAFMRERFIDKTFGEYILKRLAGDFAWNLATALSQRATEAKPSASAAPGIDTPTLRLLLADYRRSEALHEQHSRLDAVIAHIDAAIAAAREEGRVAAAIEMGKADGHQRAADVIDTLRARLAAPEGEAVAMLRYVLPYIHPNAVDMEDARSGPVEDAYINTKVRRFLALQPQAKAPQQPPVVDYVQERSKFEAWVREDETEEYGILCLQCNERDEYTTVWVASAWDGWCAHARSQQPPAGEDGRRPGCKEQSGFCECPPDESAKCWDYLRSTTK